MTLCGSGGPVGAGLRAGPIPIACTRAGTEARPYRYPGGGVEFYTAHIISVELPRRKEKFGRNCDEKKEWGH